jgi:hypothetical protein
MRAINRWLVGGLLLGTTGLAFTGLARGEKLAPASNSPKAQPSPTVKLPGTVPTSQGGTTSASQKDVDAAADTVCENWGFERGLTCWTDASANKPSAFASQPTLGDNVVASRVMRQMEYSAGGIGGDYWKRLPYPIGGVKKNSSPQQKARYSSQLWIGTFEKHPSNTTPHGTTQGDAPQGELRSKPFRVKNRYLSFLISGGKSANVGVALQVPSYLASKVPPSAGFKRGNTNDGWVEVAIAKGNDSEIMRRQVWDLQTLLGLSPGDLAGGKFVARVSIFDFDSGSWGHVSVDDFLFTAAPPPTFSVSENGVPVMRDTDQPVWGFADTHAHPTHQIGFGGKTIGGDTEGPMSQALSEDKCRSIHGGVLRTMGGRNMQHAAIGAMDEHLFDGYPTFIGWPTYRSKTHQVQHVDWMRRAFDGGQRLIVALGVTNMFWATRALGPGQAPNTPIDDETVALKQLQMMRDIVGRQSSWMEIATSPDHARRIIHQNKLAVVLGVESDNFGNFKDASYTWRDGGNYPIPPSGRLVALPADREAARAIIRQKIDAYYASNLVRQVTPLHYVSGVFGGTAVFRGQFALIQDSFTGKRYNLRNATAQEGVYYNLWKDWSGFQAFLGMGLRVTPDWYVNCVDPANRTLIPGSQATAASGTTYVCNNTSVNADGLTPRGEVLIEELMRRGMLVDTEHSSAPSASTMASIARRYGYPLMSSHSDVRELSFVPRSGKNWTGDAKTDLAEYGTTQMGNVTHEAMLGTTGFETVRSTGGTAGVITMAYRKHGYPNDQRPLVPNDCDGSSKTYAQSYLYSVDKLDGQGVALATDRGFTDFIGPRFGTHAAYRLRDESEDSLKIVRRGEQKRAQANGVRYDIGFKFFHPARFEFGDTTLEEEDAWKAMAYWAARQLSPLDNRYNALPAADKIPQSSHVGHGGRIEALVRGLAATNESQLRDCCGDTPFEEAAMLALKQNKTPEQFAAASTRGVFKNNAAAIRRIYNDVAPVYRLWNAMSGVNEPLRKRIDGVRDWDVNIDGVAHYGMLPDMLQDMANIGVTPEKLAPLFGSAEDYILMWERAEAAAAAARTALPK